MTDPIGQRFAALRARTMSPRDLADVLALPFAAVVAVLRGRSEDAAHIHAVDVSLGLAEEVETIPSAERDALNAFATAPDYAGGQQAVKIRLEQLGISLRSIDRECGATFGTASLVLRGLERNHYVEAKLCDFAGYDTAAVFPPAQIRARRK